MSSAENYYEIYIQQAVSGKQMYCLANQNGAMPSGSNPMPLIEIADVNRDGMFDLLYL